MILGIIRTNVGRIISAIKEAWRVSTERLDGRCCASRQELGDKRK